MILTGGADGLSNKSYIQQLRYPLKEFNLCAQSSIRKSRGRLAEMTSLSRIKVEDLTKSFAVR